MYYILYKRRGGPLLLKALRKGIQCFILQKLSYYSLFVTQRTFSEIFNFVAGALCTLQIWAETTFGSRPAFQRGAKLEKNPTNSVEY